MINTQIKFEGKISMVQQFLHSQGITQNFGSLKANLILKIKVKVTNFQNCVRHLDDQ